MQNILIPTHFENINMKLHLLDEDEVLTEEQTAFQQVTVLYI